MTIQTSKLAGEVYQHFIVNLPWKINIAVNQRPGHGGECFTATNIVLTFAMGNHL